MRWTPGWIALMATLVLVGGRTTLAARSALSVRTPSTPALSGMAVDPLVATMARQDSLLAAVTPGGRDPFRPWTPPAVLTASTAPKPVEAPLVLPRVELVMQDGTSITVQIDVEGHSSPRLGIGGTFRGWTILGVSGNTVTVAQGDKKFELSRP